ncbi:cold-shock protein [Paenibacillus sp. J31TS4]|uniref:cold-shock protein n=1 Tax=Paenibacillus sp. J31TS4 TaxID=2807195 RepID=UPI001B2226C4|nr:cold-shock protein [Paenibacillus sp. J31TS4]GIP37327.1 cold-shock protein [Paenibacillus sp. J31TS4]
MYNRKPVEVPEEADTSVWACTNEGCNGWMRADFSFVEEPECPLCRSAMSMEVRQLPIVVNLSRRPVLQS